MQISKVNMFNTKLNTQQNNNGTTLPIYRQNTSHSDSVSFGGFGFKSQLRHGVSPFHPGTDVVMEKLRNLPLMINFPDIAGTARLSDKTIPIQIHAGMPGFPTHNTTSLRTHIDNPAEVRELSIQAVDYIRAKVLAIAKILEETPKQDLPVADISERNIPGIHFQLFPNPDNKSFVFRHNDNRGNPIEILEVVRGQLNYLGRELGPYLGFHFLPDQGGQLFRISSQGSKTIVLDLKESEELFGKGNIPHIRTADMQIRE